MSKLTIVVPVYNVEKYLKKCIDSILFQTYKDFTLLLINDGSTDSSGDICDYYGKIDNRVKVVHKKNEGLSATRNLGIDLANSKYIQFIDSDDYIELNMCENLIDKMEKNNLDMIICGYFLEVEENGIFKSSNNIFYHNLLCETQDAFAQYVINMKYNSIIDASWNKIYLTDVVKNNHIQMPVGEVFEDTAFILDLLPHIQRTEVTDICYYHYMQRNVKTITRSFNPHKLEYLTKRHISLSNYVLNNNITDNKLLGKMNFFYIKYVFSFFIDLFLEEAKMTKRDRLDIIHTTINGSQYNLAIPNLVGYTNLDYLIIFIAKRKNDLAIYHLCKILFNIKYKNKKLFVKLKTKKGS